jgi:hypothetical protein
MAQSRFRAFSLVSLLPVVGSPFRATFPLARTAGGAEILRMFLDCYTTIGKVDIMKPLTMKMLTIDCSQTRK